MKPGTEAKSSFVAGVIAAEGAFLHGNGQRFTCVVGLGASDTATAEVLHAFFGVGTVRWFARRQPHFVDEVRWTVRRLPDLVGVIVPFMDAHLPPSHKRSQYETWRAALLDYWEHGAKRRRPCSIDGCDSPRRAYGLCRRHMYEVHGV